MPKLNLICAGICFPNFLLFMYQGSYWLAGVSVLVLVMNALAWHFRTKPGAVHD